MAHLGDVVAAARVLRAVPEGLRPAVMDELLREARQAFAHGQVFGRNHPRLGDGSLMAVALRRPSVPDPGLGDADFCRCLCHVLSAIAGAATRDPESADPVHPTRVGSRGAPLREPRSG